jgi:uncharacterized protein DUF4307
MTIAGRALPKGRYGSRGRAPARRTYWLVGAVALVAGGLIAYLAYTNLGSAPIETERTAYENVPGNGMRLSFTVTRDHPERTAVCIVRVRGRDGGEGGRKEVLIPPGETTTSAATIIRSTTEPIVADVFGCSYQVPAYLSTATRPSG